MNSHYKFLLFFCIFSIVYSLFFIKLSRYPILGDGRTYYTYGINLYKGNGYSYQESPPFLQSNLREPIYPLFICGLFKIFGISEGVIQIWQAILNGIMVMITYSLANLILNDKKRALIAAILTAVSVTIAGYAALIASETLAAVFLMLLSLLFLKLLKEKKRTKAIGLSILTGFFCGCLVLTKMTYFLFPFLICLVLIIMPKGKFFRYIPALCIAIISIVILLPWLSFNNRIYGNPFFLTNRGGMAVTVKAERLKWAPKDIIVSFIYPISEGLVQRYFPQEHKRVSYNPIEGSAFKAAYDRYDSLISQGYSEMAADKQLRVESLKKIKANILKYAILSISDFHFMLYFEGLPLSQFTGFFKKEVRGGINLFFKVYSLIIIFFAIKGVFIMMHYREDFFLKIVVLQPIIYTFFMYSAIFGAPRFTFTIIPFIYILASISICKMVKIKIPL